MSADEIDAVGGDESLDQARYRAESVRATVVAAAEEIVTRVGHALGPAPLALDAEHARRVADLQVFLRQHHAERDLAALGGLARDRPRGDCGAAEPATRALERRPARPASAPGR